MSLDFMANLQIIMPGIRNNAPSVDQAPCEAFDTVIPPAVIGGVGGSGTRLIAAMLRQWGYFIGSDLNQADDNLWFTLLFKRAELWHAEPAEFAAAVEVFRTAMFGGQPLTPAQCLQVQGLTAARPQHKADWLRQRYASLLQACREPGKRHPLWGWKEPNTHLFLDRLQTAFPRMKYIHVMRNGLDMAYSGNQNQLRLWGGVILGTTDYAITPYWSLRFWCRVHRRVIELGQRMPDRFLLLNYDAFCNNPQAGIDTLGEFLDLPTDEKTLTALRGMVQPPVSIDRFKQHGLQHFDPADVAYVAQLGFDTRC